MQSQVSARDSSLSSLHRQADAAPTADTLGLAVRRVALSSGSCSYVDEGEGPLVLLLHGAPLTSLSFVRVIRELRTSYRVVAPDFPGWGYSEAVPDFPHTLQSYASFLEEFATTLQLTDFYAFVNDSSACIGFAGLAPLADRMAGIVVADTVPLPLTGLAWPVKMALKHLVASKLARFLNRLLNLLPWMVVTVAPWLRPFSSRERSVLVAQFDTPAKRERVLDVFEQMGRDEEFMRRAADRARTHLAALPALIVYGQFDPMRLVGGVSHFREMFPDSVSRSVSFEEHFPILSSGTRVARLIHEWISARRATRGRGTSP